MKTKSQYLFVCIENACRSQMAQGLFNDLTDLAVAVSAGTKPAISINPAGIEVMKKRGIDISDQKAKILTSELVNESKKVITMGCIDECPFTPPEKTIKWDIPDPKGKEKEFFEDVRDLIEEHIKQLIEDENLLLNS